MSATSDLVQQLYVCYLGRPADPGGLAYWTQQIENNPAELDSVIDAFENSPEALALHGPFESVQERITVLYQAFFGREPDLPGMAYWTQVWDNGNATMGALTMSIMKAAQGLDKFELDARVQVANAFTAELASGDYHYGGAAAAAVGRTLMHTVADADRVLPWIEDFASTADFATHYPYLLQGLYEYSGLIPLNIVSADISPENFLGHLVGEEDSFGNPGATALPPDTVPPGALGITLLHDTGASDTDFITNDATLALTGVEDHAMVQYSTDDAMWSNGFVPQEGENTVYVRQVDAAGNVGPETGPFDFTLDTTPATLAMELQKLNKEAETFKLALTASEGVTAGLYSGPTDLGPTFDLAGGVVVKTPPIPALPSITVLNVHITDIAGNTSVSPTVIIGTSSADTITATAAQDFMYGDGGADTFQLVSSGTINVDCLDQILDYTKGLDDHDAIAAGGTAHVWDTDIAGWTLSHSKGVSTGLLSKPDATVADFYAAAQAAGAHAGEVAGFLSGEDVYLYGEGVTSGADDNVAAVLVGINHVRDVKGISLDVVRNTVQIVGDAV